MTRQPITATMLGAVGFALAACGAAGPPPALYVLGPPPAAVEAATPQRGLPIVEVKAVRLSDYLDNTDLLERAGGELLPSREGRWAERLSVGVTRALGADLAARLPRLAVTAVPPVERPAWQILVDLDSFEPLRGGQVVLVGHWSVTDGSMRKTLASERVSLVEIVSGHGDAAVVAAMSRAVQDLADRIAGAVLHLAAPSGEGR